MNSLDQPLGYFPRETAANPQAFSGERLTSAIDGQVQIEHYHRYLFARQFCMGQDVVDVASGEGYGSAHLSQVARRVVGVEYASPTARLARTNFGRPNLYFVCGDARAIPIADGSADVITSFETIEHFAGAETFVTEVRRVLRNDGCFIVSTPDRDTYTPFGTSTNPFHVREFSRREFEDLLARHFSYITVLTQRAMIGSCLIGERAARSPPMVFERRERDRFEACLGVPRSPYVVAIASNRPIPSIRDSLFIERGDLDTDSIRLREQKAETARLRAEVAQCREEMARSAEARSRDQASLVEHVTALRLSEQQRSVLQQQVVDANCRAHRIGGSFRVFLKAYLPRLYRHVLRLKVV